MVECTNCGATIDLSLSFEFTRNLRQCSVCGHLSQLLSDENWQAHGAWKAAPDLKFNELNPYTHDDVNVLVSVQTEQLLLPVNSFLTNLRRLRCMLELPLEVGLFASMMVHATEMSRDASMIPKQSTEEIMVSWIRETGPDGLDRARGELGKNVFDKLLTLINPRLLHGLESVMVAQVTGAWTAFEVLAGDLWEAALNSKPNPLATLSGIKTHGSNDKPSIQLWRLQQHQFNVTSHMGTILRGKFSFTKLEAIRDAYAKAFGDSPVRDIIDDDSLTGLSLARNVIVHKSGVIDEDFSKGVTTVPSMVHMATLDKLPIDGRSTQLIVAPAVETALKLIRAVDGWLVANS